MRTATLQMAQEADQDEWLTTGEAALLLNSSRQHVVDLCNRGDLPFTTIGTHRRVRRRDVEALRARSDRLSRDDKQSLWLGYAIAGKLVADPEAVTAKALANLDDIAAAHPRGSARHWLEEWRHLLRGPLLEILGALTSRSLRSRELRQNSPFAGVLDETDRTAVLQAFTNHRKSL